MISIARAGQADLPEIRRLLTAAHLPLDGLMAVPTTLFVARDEGHVVGAVALERHERFGLVRSLVVDESHRGAGIGSGLADAAEREAGDMGLTALYLLTETARRFFAARGFETTDRAGAPQAVASSVEWAEACADSAVPMVKTLTT